MAKTKNPVVDTLLCMLEQCFEKNAWHGPHVRASIRGADAQEAVWRPQPKRRNVAQQVLHIAYWKYSVCRRIRAGKRGSFPLKGTNWFPVSAKLSETRWEEYKQILEDQHAQLRQMVVDLATAGPSSLTSGRVHMIAGIAAHDVYHAGQIRLLRSMYESAK